MTGTPTEAIGYMASEEYASRSQTPHTTPPQSAKPRGSRPTSSSYAESPLKQFTSAQESIDAGSQESDAKVHVVPPTRPYGKYSGAGYDPPTENLGPDSGNSDDHGGFVHERGDGVPILASDEIAKYPSAEWMQPAVSPSRQMTDEEYFSAADSDHQPSYHTSHQRNRSKGRSRPSSLHSHSGLSRWSTHEDMVGTGTPLEEIEEYEPLFNDNDTDETKKSKVAAFKHQHFPSRDIWEDTPDSLRLEATVDTPEPTALAPSTEQQPSAVFEPPEAEQLRKAEFTEAERQKALQDPSKGLIKPKFKAGLQEEMYGGRPGLKQRFPSRDIWEDTPDSLRLETTIGDSSQTTNADIKSAEPTSGKPTVPARAARLNLEAKQELPAASTQSQVRDIPVVPERPKPTVPQRPTRNLKKEPSDPSPLAKTSSAESTTSANTAATVGSKPKPTVPARPAGSSKFASIKAGFMSDLNNRLSKGPLPPTKPQQEETPKEEEEEKAPLGDARKGRARGPARRKPAVSPTPAAESGSVGRLSIANPWTVWSIDSNKPHVVDVSVGSTLKDVTPVATTQPTAAQLGEVPTSSPLATNTAGEFLQPRADTPRVATGELAHPASQDMDARARRESVAVQEKLRTLEAERIGFVGDLPDPIVDQPAHVVAPTEVGKDDGAPLTPQRTEESDLGDTKSAELSIDQGAETVPSQAAKPAGPMSTLMKAHDEESAGDEATEQTEEQIKESSAES